MMLEINFAASKARTVISDEGRACGRCNGSEEVVPNSGVIPTPRLKENDVVSLPIYDLKV